jgi:hypothetical protein
MGTNRLRGCLIILDRCACAIRPVLYPLLFKFRLQSHFFRLNLPPSTLANSTTTSLGYSNFRSWSWSTNSVIANTRDFAAFSTLYNIGSIRQYRSIFSTMDITTKTPAPLESLRAGDQDLSIHRIEHTNSTDNEPHDRQLPRGISMTGKEWTEHWFIGSIDQGTTSSRFLIFNGQGNPIASHQIEFENMHPEPG